MSKKNCNCEGEKKENSRRKKTCKILKYTLLALAFAGCGYAGVKYAKKKGVFGKKKKNEPEPVVGFAIIEEDKYYPNRNWSRSDRPQQRYTGNKVK